MVFVTTSAEVSILGITLLIGGFNGVETTGFVGVAGVGFEDILRVDAAFTGVLSSSELIVVFVAGDWGSLSALIKASRSSSVSLETSEAMSVSIFIFGETLRGALINLLLTPCGNTGLVDRFCNELEVEAAGREEDVADGVDAFVGVDFAFIDIAVCLTRLIPLIDDSSPFVLSLRTLVSSGSVEMPLLEPVEPAVVLVRRDAPLPVFVKVATGDPEVAVLDLLPVGDLT